MHIKRFCEQPTVRGAVGILERPHKFGKKVKRVILTSSAVAIGNLIDDRGRLVRDEASRFLHDPDSTSCDNDIY